MNAVNFSLEAYVNDLLEVVKISPNAQSYQGHASRADLLGGVPLGGWNENHGVPYRVATVTSVFTELAIKQPR